MAVPRQDWQPGLHLPVVGPPASPAHQVTGLKAAERQELFGTLQTGACPPLSRDPGASELLYWPALGSWARIGPDLGGLTDQSVSPGACRLRELAKD